MRALTIWQPWASLIAKGDKRIENRDYPPFSTIVGERIAIHAGKQWDHRSLATDGGADLPRGAVVATAVLVGHVTESDDAFFCGPFGWLLEDIRKVDPPVPCRGYQGAWTLPAEVAAQVKRSIARG